jgi:hypothetical protein
MNNQYKNILIFIILIIILYYLYKNNEEHYGELLQYSAKGPNDTVLTGISENYYPSYYPYYYYYKPYYYRLYPYPIRPRFHYRKRYGYYLF